jgi:hypothetical protein
MCNSQFGLLVQIILRSCSVPDFRRLELIMIDLLFSLFDERKSTVDALICIQTVNCHDYWLIFLVRLNLPTILVSVLIGVTTLPFVENLLYLVISVQTFFPFKVLLIYEHFSIFNSISEAKCVDNGEFTNA